MTKTKDVKPKSGMHFEQIPVEVVKKIIGREKPKAKAGTDNLTIERVPLKTEPYSMQVRSLRKAEHSL